MLPRGTFIVAHSLRRVCFVEVQLQIGMVFVSLLFKEFAKGPVWSLSEQREA